jgi:hypothetical protein
MSRRAYASIAAIAIAVPALGATVAAAQQGPAASITASLSGRNEIGANGKKGAGDPDGFGAFTAHREGNRICWAITLHNLDRPGGQQFRVYLLRGKSTANARTAGIRLDRTPPVSGDPATGSGCKAAVGGLLDAIFSKTSSYYVDVFTGAPNRDYSGGEIRGQLRAGPRAT